MTYKGAPLSSVNQCWETPKKLIDWITKRFDCEFTLDACASEENAIADHYYTAENSCLDHHWWTYGDVWINPPFGKGGKLQREILEHAVNEVQAKRCRRVFALIPSRTDTKLFHNTILPNASHVYFVKGRITFKYGESIDKCAPFPSLLVIFSQSRSIKVIGSLDIPRADRRP